VPRTYKEAIADALLKKKEAAEYYGISEATLNKWRSVGKGPRAIKLGNSVRYRRSDLDAYAEACAEENR
jgi:excisionase family DNA binding protein